MQQTLINHPKLQVSLTTGTEGPSHDPYTYREMCVEQPDKGIVLLHEGLGTWINYRGSVLETPHGEHYVRKYMFPALTGYTVEQLERIARKLRSRCSICGGKSFHSEEGHPGESFEVCSNCGHVIESFFCESAIM